MDGEWDEDGKQKKYQQRQWQLLKQSAGATLAYWRGTHAVRMDTTAHPTCTQTLARLMQRIFLCHLPRMQQRDARRLSRDPATSSSSRSKAGQGGGRSPFCANIVLNAQNVPAKARSSCVRQFLKRELCDTHVTPKKSDYSNA